MKYTFALLLSFVCAGAPAASAQGLTDLGLNPYYAQSAWPGLHRDSSNTDFAPFVTALQNRVNWTTLDGAAVLPAPVMGPEGNLYVTTGQGAGTSHLHAFNRRGDLLWRSAPQLTLNDLDSAAALSAPVVDRDGVVFIGDRNQFWAFRANGSVKWVVALPGGPMASAILTREGYVGGITLSGKVVFFRRDTGLLAVPVFDLPGGAGPAPIPEPPGLWGGGLLDPALISDAFQMFLGRSFEVANTPAADPRTGRIFITAAGATPATGVLYGLDISGGAISIAFQVPMGAGSGTSPALSHDGARLYIADGAGVLSAIDARTGAVRWTSPQASAATSPTVGPDETVYTGGAQLTAINGKTGSIRWSRNYKSIATAVLPQLPANPPAFLTGQPVARTSGVITATGNRILAVLALGYEYTEPATGGTFLQPRASVLASISPSTGAIVATSEIRDSSEGLISVGTTGQIYVAHAAFLSSAFYYGLNQTLPPHLKVPVAPKGGFTALTPISHTQLAIDGIDHVRGLNTYTLTQLPGGDVPSAFTATRRGLMQCGATAGAVTEAASLGQTPQQNASIVNQRLAEVMVELSAARTILGQVSPTVAQQMVAAQRIRTAQTKLESLPPLLRN